MKPVIEGGVLPILTLEMERGEKIYTEKGSMTWMTDSFKMDTNAKGGFFKGIGRMLSGESLFMNTYTCQKPNGKITFASSFPGEIIEFDITPYNAIICQKQAFLCAEENVTLSMHFSKKLGTGLFGGEGFVMQKLDGNGKAFIECDGSVKVIDLERGEKIKVNTGNVAAYEETVKMDIETVKGFKNMFLGGEGIFLTTLTGPGKVYLQSMTIQDLAARIIPFIPTPTED